LIKLGLYDENLPGQPVSFHSLRRQGLNVIYFLSHDLRDVAGQAGHSLVLTTVGSYMSDLDLEGVEYLKSWNHPLNNPQLCIPLLTLAALSGKTDRRLAQRVNEINDQNPDQPIVIYTPKTTPDGERPKRPGRPAEFVSVEEGLRLLIC
jgi:hypothetical protein